MKSNVPVEGATILVVDCNVVVVVVVVAAVVVDVVVGTVVGIIISEAKHNENYNNNNNLCIPMNVVQIEYYRKGVGSKTSSSLYCFIEMTQFFQKE